MMDAQGLRSSSRSGFADVAAALPGLLTGAPKPRPLLHRLARREAHVWGRGRVCHDYRRLKRELERRFATRTRIAVADGTRATDQDLATDRAAHGVPLGYRTPVSLEGRGPGDRGGGGAEGREG